MYKGREDLRDRSNSRIDKDKVTTSTPKRGKKTNVKGRSSDITDRFIPQLTSVSAFKAAQRLKTLDFESAELSTDVSNSPSHLSLPGFFSDLRSTRHYTSVVSNASRAQSSKGDSEVASFHKIYRRYVADALGFQSAERVYQFSPMESWSTVNLAKSNNKKIHTTNHSSIDPLLSVLAPRQVLSYLTSQAFSHSLRTRSLVPALPRRVARAKAHAPFRVLDAPSLRNDFYSNLVSWSAVTGNILVGLGCAVYLWSDTRGAVNVLHYTYLQSRGDFVTCVSFSPFNRYLIVGTKQGRLLLFDQIEDEEPLLEGGYKPICVNSDKSLSGVCCIEWLEKDYRTAMLIGQENGNVHVIELKLDFPDPGALEGENFEELGTANLGLELLNQSFDVDEESTPLHLDISRAKSRIDSLRTRALVLNTFSKFKAQSQQVCGLSINKTTTQLAVGGNDNSCSIWDITNLDAPKLQFRLPHKAAVKAVAFCPWSRSLLATGGGSKDRNIRFWHTRSGTLLKEMRAPGQITALIWSLRQKQIVATFGFGDVEKPTLVSVYSYPSMTPTVEVHSTTALRVLSAAASPDHSSICVATNDETVRFYELWNIQDRTISEAQEKGIYGSDLIELTEGIHKNRELIR